MISNRRINVHVRWSRRISGGIRIWQSLIERRQQSCFLRAQVSHVKSSHVDHERSSDKKTSNRQQVRARVRHQLVRTDLVEEPSPPWCNWRCIRGWIFIRNKGSRRRLFYFESVHHVLRDCCHYQSNSSIHGSGNA